MKKALSILLSAVIILSTVATGAVAFAAAETVDAPTCVTAYAKSKHSVIVEWNETKGANEYAVFIKTKSGSKKAGKTKNTRFVVKGLKANTRYSFFVKAKSGKAASAASKTVKCKTHKKVNEKKMYAAYKAETKMFEARCVATVEPYRLDEDMQPCSYGIYGGMIIGFIDMNNDGVKEMITVSGMPSLAREVFEPDYDYYLEVFTFDGKKAVRTSCYYINPSTYAQEVAFYIIEIEKGRKAIFAGDGMGMEDAGDFVKGRYYEMENGKIAEHVFAPSGEGWTVDGKAYKYEDYMNRSLASKVSKAKKYKKYSLANADKKDLKKIVKLNKKNKKFLNAKIKQKK